MMTRAPFICLLFVSTVSANLLGGLGWSWPASLPSLANLTTWQPGNLANLAPVPFFPDFSAWIPNFFAPTSGLTVDVLENNNQSARLNCSWIGAGAESANLTLLVDGEEQNGETVNDNHGSLILTLDWSAQNMSVGQGVVVSCNGRTGKEGWASASSVSELIIVGGQQLVGEPALGETEKTSPSSIGGSNLFV